MLASAFRAAGFSTAAITAVGFLENLRNGFEEFRGAKPQHADYRLAKDNVAWAADWLSRRQPQEPFFLWVHFYDVHEWNSGNDRLERDRLEALRAAQPTGRELQRWLRVEQGVRAGGRSSARVLEAVHRYDAQIATVDAAIRELAAAFAAAELTENSLWIVTSDHGEGLGAHLEIGHGPHVYNEQLHVPLMLAFGDGRHAGRRIEDVVRLVDLAPTLAELTQVPFGGPRLEGRSLLPLLDGEDEQARLAYAERRPTSKRRLASGWLPGDVASIQDGTYKLIHRSNDEDLFFDLSQDPLELSPLAGAGPERAALQRELTSIRAKPRHSELRMSSEHLGELRSLGYVE